MSNIPQALDDIDNLKVNVDFEQIDLGQNLITSSAAVVVESFSFVFVSFINEADGPFVAGVSE